MWGVRRDKDIKGAVMGQSAGPGVLSGQGEATEVILGGIKCLARDCMGPVHRCGCHFHY